MNLEHGCGKWPLLVTICKGIPLRKSRQKHGPHIIEERAIVHSHNQRGLPRGFNMFNDRGNKGSMNT